MNVGLAGYSILVVVSVQLRVVTTWSISPGESTVKLLPDRHSSEFRICCLLGLGFGIVLSTIGWTQSGRCSVVERTKSVGYGRGQSMEVASRRHMISVSVVRLY